MILAISAVTPARGQAGPEKQEESKPSLTLVLHPAAEPRPALKYQLLPTALERHPGNAAVMYGKVTADRALLFSNEELWDKIIHWQETPLEELRELKKAGKCGLPGDLWPLDLAARCDYCDWQLPVRDEQPFYLILLPEVQQARVFARLLLGKRPGAGRPARVRRRGAHAHHRLLVGPRRCPRADDCKRPGGSSHRGHDVSPGGERSSSSPTPRTSTGP